MMVSASKKTGLRIATAALLAAIAVCAVLWFRQGTAPLPVVKKSPEFTLQNLQGEDVAFAGTNGKVRLVEFFFANCTDICPATTSNMVLMQNNLKKKGLFGSKVEFISITFDPERDTPEALGEYVNMMGIDQAAGWHMLRGTEDGVRRIANDYGLMVVKQKDGQFAHSIRSLFLVDQEGSIRKVFDMGETMDNTEIEKAIGQLVKAGAA